MKIDQDVIKYWENKQDIIVKKNRNGESKTPEEKFFETMINHAGRNDVVFDEKGCD